MNKENIIQILNDLVSSWHLRVRAKEKQMKTIGNNEKLTYYHGYISGILRAKWDLEDTIRKFSEQVQEEDKNE